MTDFTWRGEFINAEVNALHAEAFDTGFVNVLWDGLVHSWIQDLMVAESARHQRIGVALVEAAREGAKAAGCEVLHVDFDDGHRSFYFDACGFRPTNAGLIDLS